MKGRYKRNVVNVAACIKTCKLISKLSILKFPGIVPSSHILKCSSVVYLWLHCLSILLCVIDCFCYFCFSPVARSILVSSAVTVSTSPSLTLCFQHCPRLSDVLCKVISFPVLPPPTSLCFPISMYQQIFSVLVTILLIKLVLPIEILLLKVFLCALYLFSQSSQKKSKKEQNQSLISLSSVFNMLISTVSLKCKLFLL